MENQFSTLENYLQLTNEKKEQRRVANIAALSLLILFSVMLGWRFLFVRVLKNIGFPQNEISKLLKNPAINEMVQITVSFLMLVIPSLIICRVLRLKVRNIVPFGVPKNKNNAAFFVAALGFCMFASQASNIGGAILENFGFNFPSMERELPTGILGILLVVFSTSLFPALLEEFMMRGVVLGAFRRFGDGFSIIASAILFGFMHASFTQFVFAFLVGLILGFITVKSGSIWPAIIIHGANNLISIIFSYLDLCLSTNQLNTVFYVFMALLFVAAAYSTVKISKDTEFLKLEKSNMLATEAQKIKWFLFSPLVISAIVVSLIIAIFLR